MEKYPILPAVSNMVRIDNSINLNNKVVTSVTSKCFWSFNLNAMVAACCKKINMSQVYDVLLNPASWKHKMNIKWKLLKLLEL